LGAAAPCAHEYRSYDADEVREGWDFKMGKKIIVVGGTNHVQTPS